MKFEDILGILGDFGRYQQFQYFLICIPIMLCACNDMANTFLSASSDHYCRVHDNQTYQENSRLKNCTIPYEVDDGEVEWSKCDRYNVTDQDCYDGEAEVMPCDNGWVYDTSTYERTVVHDASIFN
ncbi:solute carrier family 22 member 6-B-like [Saccoglossus kowalevskii]